MHGQPHIKRIKHKFTATERVKGVHLFVRHGLLILKKKAPSNKIKYKEDIQLLYYEFLR